MAETEVTQLEMKVRKVEEWEMKDEKSETEFIRPEIEVTRLETKEAIPELSVTGTNMDIVCELKFMIP